MKIVPFVMATEFGDGMGYIVLLGAGSLNWMLGTQMIKISINYSAIDKGEGVKNKLRDILIEWGQYRDVWYINKNGTSEEKRCLIVPAKAIEPLLKETNDNRP